MTKFSPNAHMNEITVKVLQARADKGLPLIPPVTKKAITDEYRGLSKKEIFNKARQKIAERRRVENAHARRPVSK